MKKMVCYRAEFRSPTSRRRHHGDYQEIVVIAPDFFSAAQIAKGYGDKHFPKMKLVTIEIENDEVAL